MRTRAISTFIWKKMNPRKQSKDLIPGHHDPRPHKCNKETAGPRRCAADVLVRYKAILDELLSIALYEAEARASGSAEAAALAEKDTVSDRGFAGVAFRGGGAAAAWTAEAASRSFKTPLLSIRRSVLELCSDLFDLMASPQLRGGNEDKEDGQR